MDLKTMGEVCFLGVFFVVFLIAVIIVQMPIQTELATDFFFKK